MALARTDLSPVVQVGAASTVGIVTASSFEGSGAKLTGLPAGWNWVDGSLF